MRVGVLTTDGGPHPADKWAEETAGEIMSLVKIDDDYPQDDEAAQGRKRKARADKMRLEADIIEALEPVHAENQKHERAKLEEHGDERLNHHYAPHDDHLVQGVEAVVAQAQKYGEPMAGAFNSENGRALVRQAIRVHLATAMHIERGYHADRKIASGDISVHVKAFKFMPLPQPASAE